jgi:hypothetical protein
VAVSQERARSRAGIIFRLEHGMEEHGGAVSASGFGRLCQRGAAAGDGDCAGSMFAQPEQAQASRDEPLGNPSAPRLV